MPATTRKLSFSIEPKPTTGRSSNRNHYALTSPLLVQTPVDLSSADYLTQTVVSRMVYHVAGPNLLESSNGSLYEETTTGRWRMALRGLRSWLRSDLLEPDWPWDQQAQETFHASLSDHLPLALSDFAGTDQYRFADRESLLWHTGAAASLFAYATDVYGSDLADDLLPLLVRGFKDHRTWEDLIPAVFGISATEFEADWNRWLSSSLP